MNSVSPFTSKQKEDPRQAAFAAFIADDASVQELNQFVSNLGIAKAHVARGGVDTAIEHLSRAEKAPERLVVDVSGVDFPLAALGRLAEACDPSVQVYVLGDQNDVTLYRTLLQAGVQDYLVKPLTADALRHWLSDTEDGSVRRLRSGKVIAVTGTRGGVGATSIAAHLARFLTQGKGLRRVAYIDLDIHGGVGSTLLGMAANQALPEVLDNIDRIDASFLDRTLTTKDGRLFALAANHGYGDSLAAGNGRIGTLLDVLSRHFHYVIADLHDPGSAMADEALAQADIACLVTDRSVHSARALTRLIQHVESRPQAPALYVVANASRPPARGRVDVKEFAAAVSHPIAMDIPYDNRWPALAEDLGEPLTAASDLAKAIAKLARMLSGEARPQPAGAFNVGGWFRRSA